MHALRLFLAEQVVDSLPDRVNYAEAWATTRKASGSKSTMMLRNLAPYA